MLSSPFWPIIGLDLVLRDAMMGGYVPAKRSVHWTKRKLPAARGAGDARGFKTPFACQWMIQQAKSIWNWWDILRTREGEYSLSGCRSDSPLSRSQLHDKGGRSCWSKERTG